MGLPTIANSDRVLDEVVTALRRSDLPRAQRAVVQFPGVIPPEALVRLAELNLRRRRWGDAAWLFDQLPTLSAEAGMRRCLARNLAAMEQYHPEVAALLGGVAPQGDIVIRQTAGGMPTIICRRADGSMIGLSPGNDPAAAASSAMSQLHPTLAKGTAIALCGMGDGYLVVALSHDRTPLLLTMQQPVFIFEPDPRIALQCLMIHDYTGPGGPIEQQRFWWFIGPNWAGELHQLLERDPYAGPPSTVLGLSLDSIAIKAQLEAVIQQIMEKDHMSQQRITERYAEIDAEQLVKLFGPHPHRRPRVLLLTTRFSTVLQYSTRDAAEAFAQIGWEARIVIEPSPAHRLYQTAIRREVDQFQPDLVFQIDHLRREHGALFPANLPFICWIQDHLPNLQNHIAGESVGVCDFVLTDAGPFYTRHHGYAAAQIIPMSKLTRVTINAPSVLSAAPGEDVVFVSNASRDPVALASEVVGSIAGSAAVVALAVRCAEEILAAYAAGNTLRAYADVCDLVRRVAGQAGMILSQADFRALTNSLMHPLNDALYRQQALLWAARTAETLNLKLGLYGSGWDKHPTLGRYARGPVEYGRPLKDLTRRCAINLQIVPYSCLHQRLLDGLTAGGFFLLRTNPTETAPRGLLDFLAQHALEDAANEAAVRQALPLELHWAFEKLASQAGRYLCSGVGEDRVAFVRAFREAGLLLTGQDVLPRYGEIAFDNQASLEARVRRFIDDPAARREVAAQQRESIIARFSYVAGMQRMTRGIAERLKSNTSPQSSRPPIAAAAKFDAAA